MVTTPKPMTREEYMNLGLPMVWSITLPEGKPLNQQTLDFRAPENAPDGTHKVLAHGVVRRKQDGEAALDLMERCADGAVIKDGLFVAEPTVEAAFQAVCKASRIDPDADGANIPFHIFIEDWTWNEEHQVLVMGVGS